MGRVRKIAHACIAARELGVQGAVLWQRGVLVALRVQGWQPLRLLQSRQRRRRVRVLRAIVRRAGRRRWALSAPPAVPTLVNLVIFLANASTSGVPLQRRFTQVLCRCGYACTICVRKCDENRLCYACNMARVGSLIGVGRRGSDPPWVTVLCVDGRCTGAPHRPRASAPLPQSPLDRPGLRTLATCCGLT